MPMMKMKSNCCDSCCKPFLYIYLWMCFLVCLGQIHMTDGYPDGSNIPQSACESMTPSHDRLSAQTGTSPYTITLSNSSYEASSTISVTLTGSQSFKGFMIQARRASGQTTDAIGSFTEIPGQTASPCIGVATHSSSTDKSSITLTWRAPAITEGDLVFNVTFVQIKSTFWVALESEIVQSRTQQDTIQASAECGASLGCFTKCSGTCDFSVSWNEDGDYGIYTLETVSSESHPWMAIGFSYDSVMGNDSVSGCMTAPDESVSIFNAENTGRSPPTFFQDSDVTLTGSGFRNGVFSCTIRRLKTGDGQRFDITQKYTLLFARGNTNTDSVISYHGSNNRFLSTEQYSVTDRPDLNLDATPPPSAVGTVTLPSDCGVSRGCFSKCSGRQCDFIVSWVNSGSNALYTLTLATGESNPWIAVGLSSDRSMGDDSVIGCYPDSSGNIALFSGRTGGKSEPTQFTDNDVVLEDSSFNDGIISCSFRRPTAANADGSRYDATNKWFYLFASGSASGSGQSLSLAYHGIERYPSSGSYSVRDTPNEGADDPEFPLIKWHGSLMISAWIFFASIGIVAARYYKPVWTVNMCKQKVWFQIHRACMILVFCTTVAGFIIIFLEVEELSDLSESEPDRYLRAHPIMGIVVTGLTVLNPLMALIRPHPGTKNRPIFNWAHWFVGTCAHILGVITIFFGVQLSKADGPDYLVYILAGYVGWQVLVELTLEFLQCQGRKVVKSDAYNLDNLDAPKSTSEESQRTRLLKQLILPCHIFVVGAVSATLIGILAIGERELED